MKTKNEQAMEKIELISQHYENEAKKWGDSPQSTMENLIVRQMEIKVIDKFCRFLYNGEYENKLKILDIGCGNGYTLSKLSEKFISYNFTGLDVSGELLKIATSRNLKNCRFEIMDCRLIHEQRDSVDFAFTERCLINLVSWEDQKFALKEIHRILKSKGYYLMIECFTDGLYSNNKARVECGLPELKESKYNTYIDKEKFLEYIKGRFKIYNLPDIPPNYFSSHYFVARVLHPLIAKSNTKNSEFVKFFSELPPMGNYSPLQVYILKKV